MRPVHTREEYLALRNGGEQRQLIKRIRAGEEGLKHKLVQMNYSCLPNDDGTLKGSKRMSTTVGMDIDFVAPKELTADEQQAWLSERMAGVPELVLSKKDELGLLMFEHSATKGYHLVFRRRPELSQEGNLKWASQLLDVAYDAQAKDITRVFFTTSGDELLYLNDSLFACEEFFDKNKDYKDLKNLEGLNPDSEKSNKSLNPCLNKDYNGTAYSDIIAKYWELFNGGKEPVVGDRNALTFELAVTLRSICGYDLGQLMAVIPNYWGEEGAEEYRKTLENALKEPRKTTCSSANSPDSSSFQSQSPAESCSSVSQAYPTASARPQYLCRPDHSHTCSNT
jgi:hypothetical protein